MYEIWLMLNIVYELALSIWPWLLALVVLWLLLMGRAWGRRGADWRASLPGAIVGGADLLLESAVFEGFLVLPSAWRREPSSPDPGQCSASAV